jgi:hypothetical protein
MTKKNIIIIVIIIAALAVLVAGYFLLPNLIKQGRGATLTLAQIMDIVKVDKDYSDFNGLVKSFSPELVDYEKMSPQEYKILRAKWEKEGLDSRNKLTDAVKLTDSTYWVELVNKNDKSRGLLAIIDIKEKKSLLIIASISIEAGIGASTNIANISSGL